VTDVIRIQDLNVKVRIGVSDSERERPRPIGINIELATDARAAGASDDLRDTVDYSRVISAVARVAESGEFALIEHLAEKVAAIVIEESGVNRAKIEIIKPAPPVDEDVAAVSVVVERP
jgi:FolB domain-containing protein